MAEQWFCKPMAVGSNPTFGSILKGNMTNNFTYLRFKQMIMTSYLIDIGVNKNDPRFAKHLDLLRIRFDPEGFDQDTIEVYRIELFNQLQFEIDVWNQERMLRGMSI